MKFDLAQAHQVKAATGYLDKLREKKNVVELRKVSPARSLSQNSYLHLLLAAFGNHFGYTLEEAKLIYKEINRDVYIYKKKGRTFFKSSADISKDDMAKTIDVFMEKSKSAGFPLPLATDKDWLMQIENEIERAKYY